MAMTAAERKALAARRATRTALMKARRATRAAKARLRNVGPIGYEIPSQYPPQMPKSPCYLPPIKELRTRMKPQRITKRELERTVGSIEVWLGHVIKVYDKMCPKKPRVRR